MATAMIDEEDLDEGVDEFTPCPKHSDKRVLFVCVDCSEEWVCALCVTTCHKEHSLDVFKDYVERKRQSIVQKMHDVEHITLPSIKQQIEQLNSELEENVSRTERAKKAIMNRSEELKAELDKISRRYTRVCRKTAAENDSRLEIHREHLENIYQEFMQDMAKLQQQLLEKINEEIDESQVPKVGEQPECPSTATTVFEAGQLKDQIANLFGDLKIIKERICDIKTVSDIDFGDDEDTENDADNSNQSSLEKREKTSNVSCTDNNYTEDVKNSEDH